MIISSLISMICLSRDSPGLLKKLSVNGDRRFLVSWYFLNINRSANKRKNMPQIKIIGKYISKLSKCAPPLISLLKRVGLKFDGCTGSPKVHRLVKVYETMYVPQSPKCQSFTNVPYIPFNSNISLLHGSDSK